MASSTRSRKTRKSRANTHIPGAARIRPRMQHNLSSPDVQTNTGVVRNTTGNSSINNLVTPQIPSIATQTSQTTTVVSPESFTTPELKRIDNDNDINQMSNIASELKEPSSALSSLNAIKEQPSDTINQFSITDNENSKVKGISSTKMSKPSLETQANESTPHLQESTEVENKRHDVNKNMNYNNANRSDDKRESVNLSPENKTNNTIMTESVSEMPIANKRVMTATKAHRNKLHLVHTTTQQEQQQQRLQERHHNTSDASHQTADIDSHTHVTSNDSNNSEIDNVSKKENKKEMEKSVEDVYANAQTIEIEIPPPPPPPLQPLQSSVTSEMQQENNSNNEAVNVETRDVEQNENTSSINSNKYVSNENVNVKGNVESRQDTSTTPMTHTDITSVHSHVTKMSNINALKDSSNVHLEADANSATNRHAKHNNLVEHVTDLHVKQSLQKEKHQQQHKQQSEKRMMRKRSNGNKMKRGNSNVIKAILTTVVAANSNHVSINHDKSVKESITMDEQPKQGTTSEVLTNNDEETVNIGQIQEQNKEVRQEQTKQSNTVAPANADTINTESNKMQNMNGATETSIPQIEHEKTEHTNKRVKFKLTLLEDIHKQINPAESSSVSDVTHARATISKTNLLKRRKTFPQQTEVNIDNNNNSESRIVNAGEMKITESNNVEEQEKQKYTLPQSEKEEEHKVINVNMSNTTSLASQQSQHALEELQQEKKMNEKTISEYTDNLSTTTESVNVKEQIPILAHDTSSSIVDTINTSESTTENIIAVNDNSAMTKPLLRTNRANMTKVITKRKGKYGKSNEIHTAASSFNKENNNIISSSSNNGFENNHIASENDDNEGKNVENPTTQLQSVKDSQHLHSQKQEEPPHKGIDASIYATISERHVRNKIDINVQMEGKGNKNGAKEITTSENNSSSNIHNDNNATDEVIPMNETSAATKESVETNANSLSLESHRLRFFVELDEPSTTSQAAKAATVIITPNDEVVQIDNLQNVECMNESATHNGADCVNQKTASQVQGTGHKMHKIIDRKRLQSTTVVAEQQVKKPNESVEPIKRVGAVMMKAHAGKLRQRITAQSIPSAFTSTFTTASDDAPSSSSQKHLSSIHEEQQRHGKELEQKQEIVANHANEKVNTENKSTANDTNDKTELPEEQSKLQKEEILLKQSEAHSSSTEKIDVPSQPSVTTSTTLPPAATKESIPHEDNNQTNSKSKNNSKVSIKRVVRTKRRLAKREELQKQKQRQEEENLPSPQLAVKEETTTKLHQPPSHLHQQHSSPMGYIAAHPDITDVTVINRIRKRQEMERKLRKARRAWLQQKISNDGDNDGDNNKKHATNEDKVINIQKEMNIEISNENNNFIDSSNKFANHKSEVKGEMKLSESNVNHTIFSESNKHRHEGNEQVELYSRKASAIQQQDTISEESNIDESEKYRSMFDKVNRNMAFTKQHADNVATKRVESNTESEAVHTHPGQEHTPQQMPTSNLAEHSQPHTARVMQKFNVKKAKHQHPSPALQETHDNTHKSSKDDVVTNTNINLDCSASELKDEVGNKKVSTTQELINSAENNNNGMESVTHTERNTQEKQEGKEKLSLSDEQQQQQEEIEQTSIQSDIQEETPREEKTDGIADNVERINVDNTKCNINENAIASSDAAHIINKESPLTKITRPRKKTKRQLVHSPSRSNKHKRKNRNKRKTVIAKQKEEHSVEITQEPNMEVTIKENVLNKYNQISNTDKNNEEMENDTLLQERQRNNKNENVKVELVTHQTLSLSSHEQPLEEQIGNANNTSESAMNEENISETNNNDETVAVDEESREQELELFSTEQQEEQQEIMENVSMETHDQQVEAHEEEEEQEEENVEIQEILKQEYANRELKQAEEQQLSSPIHKKRFFTELEPSSASFPELDTQENVKSEEESRNFVSNTNNVTDNTIPLEQGMNAANDQEKQHRKSLHQPSIKAKSKTHHINNKIINSEFTSVDSDDVNTTTNAISTNDATHSHIKSKNEVESTDDSQCDMLTQNKHVAQSFETNANNEHLNDNENTVEHIDEESILGVRSNRKEEMTSKHSGKENDKSDSKKDATCAKETELFVEPNVQIDLPSSPHVESLHKPEVQATVPFALRHFPKKIMKMMKLNKKRVSVFTAPESNNNDYVKHTDADEEDTIQKNMANDDITKTDNSVHEEQCTNNVVNQNQMGVHIVNATLAELEGTANVASQIEPCANAQSLRSCQEEEQQEEEWKQLQELEVEKQQQQRELKYEQKKEQKKLTEVDNREETDATVKNNKNNYITTDNIVANTEVSLTPQVLRRLSAKRKIKKHAELAAARRKSKANMTSSITSNANTKLNNGNEQEQQIEEKQDLFVKDAEMPNKVDAVNNNTQLETENANIQCTQQQQQNNEASNNDNAKFLHHKRKSNLKELDALSQIDHLIHYAEESTPTTSHTKTINTPTCNNNYAGVIDHNSDGSNIIKPALHTSEEMLLNKYALPLPSGNVLLEEFSEKEMLLRRSSLEVPWEVGLRFDWNLRTLALGSFPAFTATDPRSRHPFMSLYHSRPAWYLHEVNGVNATQMKEVMEAMKRSLTARFIFRRVERMQ